MAVSLTFGSSSTGGSRISGGSVVVEGFDDLTKKLRELDVKVQNKILRKAMRQAARPMLARAKANAPVGKSDTFDSLATRTKQLGAALGATAKQQEKAAQRTVKQATKEAKKAGEHYPGQLRDSLAIRAIKRNRNGRVGVVIQTRAGDFKGRTFYASFIEYGTNKMAARPFIRPAFDTEAHSAIDIVAGIVRRELFKLASE
jgi:HK97 gp10 family phage protein